MLQSDEDKQLKEDLELLVQRLKVAPVFCRFLFVLALNVCNEIINSAILSCRNPAPTTHIELARVCFNFLMDSYLSSIPLYRV